MKIIMLSLLIFASATPALAAESSAPRFSDLFAAWIVRTFRIPQFLVAPPQTDLPRQTDLPASQVGNCKPDATPVCGMNGKTYPCRASAGNEPIASAGECPSEISNIKHPIPVRPAGGSNIPKQPFVVPSGLGGRCDSETSCTAYCKKRWYLPACFLPTWKIKKTPGLFGNVPSSTPPQPLPGIPRQFLPSGEIPPQPTGAPPTGVDLFREIFLKPR